MNKETTNTDKLLPAGICILTRTVDNPRPDRRTKHYFQQAKWHNGDLFLVKVIEFKDKLYETDQRKIFLLKTFGETEAHGRHLRDLTLYVKNNKFTSASLENFGAWIDSIAPIPEDDPLITTSVMACALVEELEWCSGLHILEAILDFGLTPNLIRKARKEQYEKWDKEEEDNK